MRRNREWHPVNMALVRRAVLHGVERVDGERGGETYYARTLHVSGRWTLEVSLVKKHGYILVVSVYWKGYHD